MRARIPARQNRRVALFLATLFAFLGMRAVAQQSKDARTALIITYRVKPQMQAAFRRYMETVGVHQLETWKQQHVFRSYMVLFSSYAAAQQQDGMTILLSFSNYADTAKWMQIEKTMPGGLAPAALAMAIPETSTLADQVMQEKSASADSDGSVFMLLPYVVAASPAEYKSYVAGYVVPQLRGWLKRGTISSYRIYLNQNPAGAEWSSLLLLEYSSVAALGQREAVKNAVRQELSRTDAAWRAFSQRKTSLRTEKSAVIATQIRPH